MFRAEGTAEAKAQRQGCMWSFQEEEKGQCGRSDSGKEGRTGMWWERQSTGVLAKALRFRRTQIRDIPTAS